jgi:hypothetical protein
MVRAAVGAGEAAYLGQRDGTVGAVDVAQYAAGADGGELAVVANEPQGCAVREGVVDDGCQLQGAGHPGLVDDHEAARTDRLDPVGDGDTGRQRVDEFGEVVRRGHAVAELLAQHPRRRGGGRQADHSVPVRGPCLGNVERGSHGKQIAGRILFENGL